MRLNALHAGWRGRVARAADHRADRRKDAAGEMVWRKSFGRCSARTCHSTSVSCPRTVQTGSGALLRCDRAEGRPALFNFFAATVRTEDIALLVVDERQDP